VALGAGAVADEAVAAGRQPDARIRPEGRDWVGDNLYTVDEGSPEYDARGGDRVTCLASYPLSVAAVFLGVSHEVLDQWRRDGHLRCVRDRGVWVVPLAELDRQYVRLNDSGVGPRWPADVASSSSSPTARPADNIFIQLVLEMLTDAYTTVERFEDRRVIPLHRAERRDQDRHPPDRRRAG
jgi:hypothetical protein